MRKIKSHVTGVDQGNVILFSDFQDDGPMWAGSGPRELITPVAFSETFRDPPTVHVPHRQADMDSRRVAKCL